VCATLASTTSSVAIATPMTLSYTASVDHTDDCWTPLPVTSIRLVTKPSDSLSAEMADAVDMWCGPVKTENAAVGDMRLFVPVAATLMTAEDEQPVRVAGGGAGPTKLHPVGVAASEWDRPVHVEPGEPHLR
jgi:hypothetical protein